MKSMLYVYNPKAGKGKLEEESDNILEIFRNSGFSVTTHATTAKGDGYAFVRRYLKACLGKSEIISGVDEDNCKATHTRQQDNDNIIEGDYTLPDRIVCAGGDGTVQEIVRAVKDSFVDIPIGIIPSGSTNDFGYSLGIGKDIRLSARIAASDAVKRTGLNQENCGDCSSKSAVNVKNTAGREFMCDCATINGKYFVYTAAFGLFSEVSYATPQKMKNILGRAAYILYGAATLFKNRKIHAKIRYINQDMEAELLEEDLLLGMVVSAKSVGGFRGITGRNVKLDDGLDELILVCWPKNPFQLFRAVSEALMHKENGKCFRIIKASNIRFSFDRKIKWSVDGEYGGKGKKVEIDVEKKGITYIRNAG